MRLLIPTAVDSKRCAGQPGGIIKTIRGCAEDQESGRGSGVVQLAGRVRRHEGAAGTGYLSF